MIEEYFVKETPTLPTLSACKNYMYALFSRWSTQEKLCVFIMLNPARTYNLGNNLTVKSCRAIAGKENCGGMFLLDLFAYVAGSGRLLAEAKIQGLDIIGGAEHDKHVREVLQIPNLLIIAAWGDKRNYETKKVINFYDRIEHMKQMIKEHAVSNDIKQLEHKNEFGRISHPYWFDKLTILDDYRLEPFLL